MYSTEGNMNQPIHKSKLTLGLPMTVRKVLRLTKQSVCYWDGVFRKVVIFFFFFEKHYLNTISLHNVLYPLWNLVFLLVYWHWVLHFLSDNTTYHNFVSPVKLFKKYISTIFFANKGSINLINQLGRHVCPHWFYYLVSGFILCTSKEEILHQHINSNLQTLLGYVFYSMSCDLSARAETSADIRGCSCIPTSRRMRKERP